MKEDSLPDAVKCEVAHTTEILKDFSAELRHCDTIALTAISIGAAAIAGLIAFAASLHNPNLRLGVFTSGTLAICNQLWWVGTDLLKRCRAAAEGITNAESRFHQLENTYGLHLISPVNILCHYYRWPSLGPYAPGMMKLAVVSFLLGAVIFLALIYVFPIPK